MFDLPKRNLVRKAFRLHNPRMEEMDVCVEPWSDRFSLGSKQTMELVFVGPREGDPEVVPYFDEVLVYGWEGSEFAALQENRLMGSQPTVEDVLRQELEIAKDRVQRTNKNFPEEQIIWAQHAFDIEPALSHQSQENAIEVVAILTIELAPSFQRSKPATELLWHMISRLVGIKGLFIGSPSLEERESVWSEHPGVLTQAVRKQSISVLPSHFTSLARGRLARPQSFESESDPTPR